MAPTEPCLSSFFGESDPELQIRGRPFSVLGTNYARYVTPCLALKWGLPLIGVTPQLGLGIFGQREAALTLLFAQDPASAGAAGGSGGRRLRSGS